MLSLFGTYVRNARNTPPSPFVVGVVTAVVTSMLLRCGIKAPDFVLCTSEFRSACPLMSWPFVRSTVPVIGAVMGNSLAVPALKSVLAA